MPLLHISLSTYALTMFILSCLYIYSTYFLLYVHTRRAASSRVAEQYSGTHYISTIYIIYIAHAIIIISHSHRIMYLFLYIYMYVRFSRLVCHAWRLSMFSRPFETVGVSPRFGLGFLVTARAFSSCSPTRNTLQ